MIWNRIYLTFGIIVFMVSVSYMLWAFGETTIAYLSDPANPPLAIFLTGNFLHKLGELMIFVPLILGVILAYTPYITRFTSHLRKIKTIIFLGGLLNLAAFYVYVTQNGMTSAEFLFGWTILLFVVSAVLATSLFNKMLDYTVKSVERRAINSKRG